MGFHDGMTKEIHIINRGYVTPDHGMMMSHQFDAQLFIQSQWPPHGMELVFISVLEMSISDAGEYCGAVGTVEIFTAPVEKTTVEMQFDASLKIKAEKLFYRTRENWTGPEAFLLSEVPSPEAVSASVVEDKWRQCSECCNIWEENEHEQFALCPDCKRLTELK